MSDLPQQDIYHDNARLDVAPYIPAGARSVLEVGCGKGGFGPTLRRALGDRARIVGIEAVPAQAAVARSGHGFDEVVDGYFPQALTGEERFDLVCFNDVLEHVVDPWATLGAATDLLQPGGHVLAAIPSIQYAPVTISLLRGRWDYTDEGTLDRTHVRFFTRGTMTEMFDRAGLDVVTCAGVNSVYEQRWSRRSPLRRAWTTLMPDAEWLHFVVLGRLRAGGGSRTV
ncbi:class I SAM-dependent methyltransferase [Terrabacter carboxydivorans]|uniref:Class I SAM-dependent methyltransferase n=1 Tax=Terrabacter carboxydivorans TaxID=619730 RepID=A0ABP5ZDY8_9MICO